MTTRLDRLVLLLDTGSNATIRSTAAKQLGEIQKQQPDQLYILLARVLPHLRSKSWETRTAASQAMEAIAAAVSPWNPPPGQLSASDFNSNEQDLLSFTNFDIDQVVKNGSALVASAGNEFDVDLEDMDPKERIAFHKKQIKSRMGLDFIDDNFDFIGDNDFATSNTKSSGSATRSLPQQLTSKKSKLKRTRSEDEEDDGGDDSNGLSARERNRLKRKQKLAAKDRGKEKVRVVDLASSSTHGAASIPQGIPVANTSSSNNEESVENTDESGKVVVNFKSKEEELASLGVLSSGDEWPFEGLCEQLFLDLFDLRWEVRHGAALGLRSVFKSHLANEAGTIVGLSRADNAQRHRAWMEDAAIRLLCVLALDRFKDFVTDAVVYPVRETVAQVLGVLVQTAERKIAQNVLEMGLFRLVADRLAGSAAVLDQYMWEIRYAGLLGLKYLLAVREDLVSVAFYTNGKETLLWRAVIKGLHDSSDDVRAVSSSALNPIVSSLVALMPHDKVFKDLVLGLWDCLLDLDDLTSSTGSVMDLLSKLLLNRECASCMTAAHLQDFTPRLYPFLRHTSSSVRIAVLNVISTLFGIATSIDAKQATVITPDLMCRLFQNFLLETRKDVLEITLGVWKTAVKYLGVNGFGTGGLLEKLLPFWSHWLTLVATPLGTPLNSQLLLPRTGEYGHDRNVVKQDLTVLDWNELLEGRVLGATAIGYVLAIYTSQPNLPQTTVSHFSHTLAEFLKSRTANYRVMTGIVIQEWAQWFHDDQQQDTNKSLVEESPVAKSVWDAMVSVLTESDQSTTSGHFTIYSETIGELISVRMDCQGLLSELAELGIRDLPSIPPISKEAIESNDVNVFNPTVAAHWVNTVFPHYLNSLPPFLQSLETSQRKPPQWAMSTLQRLHDTLSRIRIAFESCLKNGSNFDARVLSSFCSALVSLKTLPPRITPVVKTLMTAIQTEKNALLQERYANSVGALIELMLILGKSQPVERVVKNICGYLFQNEELYFEIWGNVNVDSVKLLEQKGAGIWSLMNPGAVNSAVNGDDDTGSTTKSVVSGTSSAPASKSLKKKKSMAAAVESVGKSLDSMGVDNDGAQTEEISARRVTRRGAELALKSICARFGEHVFDKVPVLWEMISTGPIVALGKDGDMESSEFISKLMENLKSVVESFLVTKSVAPYLAESVRGRLTELLQPIVRALRTQVPVLRFLAAISFATVCTVLTVPAMQVMVRDIVPLLGDTTSISHRQGASETIFHVVSMMDIKILPYIVFLIVPVLGRMSDIDEGVRFLCTNVFATLVKLIPLESGVENPEGFPEEMLKQKAEERKFIGQLIGSEQVSQYEIPVPVNAELRSYQKDGVSWLAFLNRYQLHGILCDDMGLGKTLQTICILASDHHTRAERFAKTQAPDSIHAPSLVICPPTLMGHWYHEILNYVSCLKPLKYVGPPAERASLFGSILKHDVIITSYDIIRNDVEMLKTIDWNYCVLDEGHIIKNPKAKLTQAIKSLKTMKRLILSGTPIQNNVLELWSLFDFLMPGFLGTERQFNDRFGKKILASRDAKSSSKQQEAGALALEALHKQVLPFLLRRMKEDVLHDLPPKIIQDYYCDLSDLQAKLYENFSKSQTVVQGEEGTEAESSGKGHQHVFQSLQYLRKLCNHPALVVNEKHPQHRDIVDQLAKSKSHLRDIAHAPKITALRQLLLDCGIGASSEEGNDNVVPTVAPHRALIFAQLKPMLDIIEDDLFKKLMPNVTYMRLDGSVEANKRHDIVQKFNQDPSIDVLLLTTHVGGLGLNLTGADTVIFVEHDWNPMKDLQAMDRAHRLGQKRVVNVYRLITRGTLEEKIMGLQKFKMNIASSVINQDNKGLPSMDTEGVLDLFNLYSGDGVSDKKADDKKKSGKLTTKQVLEQMEKEGLWGDEYDELGNMDEFLKGLSK